MIRIVLRFPRPPSAGNSVVVGKETRDFAVALFLRGPCLNNCIGAAHGDENTS